MDNSDYYSIGHRDNFTGLFFRNLTICILANLENRLVWVNRFSSGDTIVELPVYYSNTGTEDFLNDTFVDDIASEVRLNEFNMDEVPRGSLTLESWNINSSSITNSNVYTKKKYETSTEIRNVLSKTRSLPINANYKLEILVKSEADSFKASEALMNVFAMYRHIYFNHNYMMIDAYMTLPDDFTVEIAREVNFTSKDEIKITCNFKVITNYPSVNWEKVLPKHGQAGVYPSLEGGIVSPKKTQWNSQLRKLNKNTPDHNNIFDDKLDDTQNLVNKQYFDNTKQFDLYEEPSPDTTPEV